MFWLLVQFHRMDSRCLSPYGFVPLRRLQASIWWCVLDWASPVMYSVHISIADYNGCIWRFGCRYLRTHDSGGRGMWPSMFQSKTWGQRKTLMSIFLAWIHEVFSLCTRVPSFYCSMGFTFRCTQSISHFPVDFFVVSFALVLKIAQDSHKHKHTYTPSIPHWVDRRRNKILVLEDRNARLYAI